MKAWILHDVNGPDSFHLEETPTPEPGPGEVRVRIESAALNHLDLWVSMGMPKPHLPHVAGADGAGVVDEVGEGVRLDVGTEVVVNPSVSCGRCPACLRGDPYFCPQYGILGEHRWGTLADYVVVPERNVVLKPPALTWNEAGAYGLAYGTAYRMLQRARLAAGDVLLVIGIGGGVAGAAMLIGRAMGATVYVTSRDPAKIDRAIALGADGGFDSTERYDKAMNAGIGRGADVVVETVGAPTWDRSLRTLEPGGRLVTCGATGGINVELSIPRLFFKQYEILGSTMYNFAEFDAVTRLVAGRRVPVVIDSVFDFDVLPEAISRMQQGEQFGKIVISRS